MQNVNLILGLIGMTLILLAFTFDQFGKWSSESLSYDLTNFVGSGLMIYYAYTLKSWPFAILNLVWMLVSLRDVIIHLTKQFNR